MGEQTHICLVLALLSYMAVHPAAASSSSLLIHVEGSPLTSDQLVLIVGNTYCTANIHVDQTGYSGHSFHIEAASAASEVPSYFNTISGCWESKAYLLYLKDTLREPACSSVTADSQLTTCTSRGKDRGILCLSFNSAITLTWP